MIKIILFDVDGVINHSEWFGKSLGEKYGIAVEKTQPFFLGIFQECLRGKADIKEVIPPYLKQWGWKKSVDDYIKEWFSFEHKIHEGMIAEVKALQQKGIKCYLATNQEKYRTEYILNNMGFKHIFDGIFSSSDIGHIKEDKQFFLYVLEQLKGIQPQEILFWDDKQIIIDTAKQVDILARLYISFDDFKKNMDQYLS